MAHAREIPAHPLAVAIGQIKSVLPVTRVLLVLPIVRLVAVGKLNLPPAFANTPARIQTSPMMAEWYPVCTFAIVPN